jgi:hypothetical protein
LQATAQSSELTSNFVNFESRLDVVDHGTELDAVIYSVKLFVRSSATSNRATKLDTVIHGVETCNLDAMALTPRVQS